MEESKIEEHKSDYISITEDSGIKKKIIKEGSGPIPKQGDEVTINYLIKKKDNNISNEAKCKQYVLKIGSNQVVKGLEIGVKTMKVGEKADFIFSPDYTFGIETIYNSVPENSTLEFEIELLNFVLPQKQEMTYEEKLLEAKKIKEEGVEKFKSKDIVAAINLFEKTKIFLEEIDKNEIEGVNLYIATLSNLCNCYNQQKEYHTVIKYATKGLKLKELPKFYYFRAIAYANNDEINFAKNDLEKLKALLDENKRETDEGIKFLNDLIEKRKNIGERKKHFLKRFFSKKNNLRNTENIKNYIIAEITIEENDIGKDIKIINSYEERYRIRRKKCDDIYYSSHENEREIQEKCIIKINNK